MAECPGCGKRLKWSWEQDVFCIDGSPICSWLNREGETQSCRFCETVLLRIVEGEVVWEHEELVEIDWEQEENRTPHIESWGPCKSSRGKQTTHGE